MYTVDSVYHDLMIPGWRTMQERIKLNVLILVIEGKVVYYIEKTRVVLEQGDLLILPNLIDRAGEDHESGPHQKYTILFTSGEETELLPFLRQDRHTLLKPRSFEALRRRFEKLFMEMRGVKSFRSMICQGILQELLGITARELEQPEIAPMKVQYARTIQNYLLCHYRESIEIEQLAKLIGCSENYTISVYKEVTGQSPIKYLHRLRILEACYLLLNTKTTVAAISQYSGYYDASYFFRMFKQLTSMSPSEFIAIGQPLDMEDFLG
ncbi:AraC family transcriptional regulator [Paenibacillus sp. FSL H8-0332]|uniref:helix-turn-helix domain-containing protein n=1 Tax=Paenibacillus sp. FSL H8-0332 TaxID=2954742 RepID=UPI0030D56BC8